MRLSSTGNAVSTRLKKLRSIQSALDEIHLRVAAVFEVVNPRVLEKAPDDRTHVNVLRHPGHAGPQRAHAAHDQIDFYARLRRAIQRMNHLRVDQCIHLRHHARALPFRRLIRFVRDQVEHRFVQRERRLQELLQATRPAHRRQLLEYLVHVLADGFVAREQAVVGVHARGARVVVAGSEMDVTPQHPAFATNHHAHLRVRLVPHDAVHDLRAGRLQLVREFDVGLFVETRAQLDDDEHVLAGVCGIDQRLRDGGVEAGSIQRLSDRQHVRVRRRLAQKIDDRRKRLIRMLQQQVAFADHLEDVLALLQTFRHARV